MSDGTVRYDAKHKKWVIKAAPHILIRVKRVFERVAKNEFGAVTLADTPENCRELEWFLQRYPLDLDAPQRLFDQANTHRAREAAVAQVLAPDYKPPPVELALPLREYQQVAVALARANGALLLGDDVGLGKTASAIGLLADPGALPALVVTLTHLPKQWEAEIQRFAPALKTHVLKSGRPYDLTQGPRGKKVAFPDVIVTNYHKLRGWADVLGEKVKTAVFDEIQELRTGAEADKWKAAKYIADRATLKAGLSATPIYNYGGEIYNILSVLFPQALGSYGEFNREWCGGNDYGGDRSTIKDPKAFGTYLREQGLMLRRTRAEVGRELPDLSKIPYVIEADLAEFDKIESSAVKLAQVLLAQGGLEKGAKLHAAEELSWMLRQATGIAKAPYVADFVRLLIEQGEKVVLFGWHKAVYEIWRERLKDFKPAFYTGDESPTQKGLARDRFLHGDTPLLVLSLRAGAGLDGLQKVSRTVVFGEIDWSPGVHTQCIGRVFRDGQLDKVAAYFLLSHYGSDPVVADVLGVKRVQSDSMLDPTAELVDAFTGGASDVKKLAETFLKQRGVTLPGMPVAQPSP